jgi:hypothetical protein
MKRKVYVKILMALLAALFAIAFFISTEWPVPRSVRVRPGVFVERIIITGDFWLCFISGVALSVVSGYLFWTGFRDYRYDA